MQCRLAGWLLLTCSVNAHTKGHRGHHHIQPAGLPIIQHLLALAARQPGVVRSTAHTSALQLPGQLVCCVTLEHIHHHSATLVCMAPGN